MNYTNVVLSSHPCPICQDARGKSMTLEQWKKSPYGLTDSKKRYCNLKGHFCHCVLVPENVLPELPEIGKRVKLRGDEGTDIRAIVEIHPNEAILQKLMDEYNAEIGRLPDEFYELPIEQCIPYLRRKLGKG